MLPSTAMPRSVISGPADSERLWTIDGNVSKLQIITTMRVRSQLKLKPPVYTKHVQAITKRQDEDERANKDTPIN
ncbi:jg2947 [Pararge aegeria aegeria]|uniref:Jg2947 protein n=1 Tax=Pararge aegeria aegeria TaxID=348720 RepID=A0A8S4SDJ7_9NEOP|nr:jg2947 [Pararge aegeria aegeria]